MSNAGRPTKYDENYHPQKFIEMSRDGKIIAAICGEFGIHRGTLNEWAKKYKKFYDAVKKGMELREAYFMQIGVGLMAGKFKGGSAAAWIFTMKNIGGWRDKLEVSIDEELEIDLKVTKHAKET